MKPTLVLLAAGMGSRYGGLKQLDGLGPNGETIMDYSIYDAIQAGFGKIVFIIRKDFEEQFRTQVLSKYEGHIPAEVCFQALDALPDGYSVPEGRTKPWGTNHAVLMAKNVVKEPFCVINCDDFYNRDCFKVIGKFLADLPEGAKNTYAMVGFRVGNTLSENGTVSRGVCSKDEAEHLTTVVERTEIERKEERNKVRKRTLFSGDQVVALYKVRKFWLPLRSYRTSSIRLLTTSIPSPPIARSSAESVMSGSSKTRGLYSSPESIKTMVRLERSSGIFRRMVVLPTESGYA